MLIIPALPPLINYYPYTLIKKEQGWKISRISKISLALLRVAIYEMLYQDDIPVSVSINEAVELAKKYTGVDDSAFVNGVLGAVAKEL